MVGKEIVASFSCRFAFKCLPSLSLYFQQQAHDEVNVRQVCRFWIPQLFIIHDNYRCSLHSHTDTDSGAYQTDTPKKRLNPTLMHKIRGKFNPALHHSHVRKRDCRSNVQFKLRRDVAHEAGDERKQGKRDCDKNCRSKNTGHARMQDSKRITGTSLVVAVAWKYDPFHHNMPLLLSFIT